VAATGLLGINPYYKGVNIDISKPVNLAIQLQQKEAAKQEALDKYFMDYEKSINPAGVRKQEGDILLQKLAENKEFYLKNRDKILNPAKYGYDAQSQYMANFKDMTNLINQSKQAAANEKVVNEHIYQAVQQGKTLHDGLLPELDRQRLSVLDPNYKTVDPYALQFDKPHDEAVFNKNVWGNLKLPTREIPEKLPNGQVQYRKESYLSPEVAQTAVVNAINEYKTSPNTAKHFNQLMQDNSILAAADDIFGKTFKYIDPQTKKTIIPKIETPEQFVAGYALLKKPSGEVSTSRPDYPWLYKFSAEQSAINARAKKEGETPDANVHIFDKIGGEGNPVTLPADTKTGRVYKINYGVVEDEKGNPATVTTQVAGTDLPQDIFSVLKESKLNKDADYIIKSQNGKIVSIKPTTGNLITREYAGNEQSLYYGTKKDLKKTKQTSAPVAETWADRLKKKRK